MVSETSSVDQVRASHKWPFTRTDPLLPSKELAEIRSTGELQPIEFWDGSVGWIATRHEDIRNLLRNPVMSADSTLPGYPNSSANHAASRGGQKQFIRMDGAPHDDQRRMVAKALSIPEIAKLRPFIESVVDRLLDDMERHGAPANLVDTLAEPLPSEAICEILGLPQNDAHILLDMVNRWMNLDSPPAVSAAASAELEAYLDNLVADRTGEGGEDLVSRLVREQFEPGHITRSELVAILHLLIIGGFDTTANMIAMGTILLMRHPDQRDELRNNPELAPAAIEEILRYLSVAHHVASRVPTEDVIVRSVTIKAGEGVLAPVPAANHDPEVFANPEIFDIHRDARNHLAFGFGIHQCLGQNLARLELQIVFTKLLARFPNLRLAVPESDLDFRNSMIYGVRAVPVKW